MCRHLHVKFCPKRFLSFYTFQQKFIDCNLSFSLVAWLYYNFLDNLLLLFDHSFVFLFNFVGIFWKVKIEKLPKYFKVQTFLSFVKTFSAILFELIFIFIWTWFFMFSDFETKRKNSSGSVCCHKIPACCHKIRQSFSRRKLKTIKKFIMQVCINFVDTIQQDIYDLLKCLLCCKFSAWSWNLTAN